MIRYIFLLAIMSSLFVDNAEGKLEDIWKQTIQKHPLKLNRSFTCREVFFFQSGFYPDYENENQMDGYGVAGTNEGTDNTFKVKFETSEKCLIDNEEYTVIKTPSNIYVALRTSPYGMTMAVFDFDNKTMSYTSNNVAPLLGMGNRTWLTRCY